MKNDRLFKIRQEAIEPPPGRFAGASPVGKYSVAIIGGAGVGVSVFRSMVTAIAQTPRPDDFTITIYEKSGQFGTGIAYGTTLPAHILNMRSSTMSAIGAEQNHFVEWILRTQTKNKHVRNIRAVDFPPRMIFAEYLHDLFRETQELAAALGIELSLRSEEAISLTARDDGSISVDTGDDTRTYESVILCVGNQPPAPIKRLRGAPGYFSHAWPETRLLREVPKDAEVLILGSGLTAIDAFITLQEGGHTGQIVMASRHGLLPKVRGHAHPHVLSHLNTHQKGSTHESGTAAELSINKVAGLLLQELAGAGVLDQAPMRRRDRHTPLELLCSRALLVFRRHQARLMAESPSTILRRDIEDSEEAFQGGLSVLKAADEIAGHVWSAMTPDARREFDRVYKSLWNAYDYPMPKQNAVRVLAALESGQLSVRRTSGRPEEEVSYDPSSRLFSLGLLDLREQSETVSARCVIDATGQGLNIREMRLPLISDALRRGLIVPHDRGGIDVDFETGAVRNARGECNPNLLVVGALTRGVHFYTNSMNENAKCGKRAVLTVLDHYWERVAPRCERRRSA